LKFKPDAAIGVVLAAEGENVAISEQDIPALVACAQSRNIDFVIPGPELPLTLGVVDAMRAAGIPAFGPDAWCARLEGSKTFAKRIMQQAGIPTAACGVFSRQEEAAAFVKQSGAPIVVKADGLAAGKGVIVARTVPEALDALDMIMGEQAFGTAGSTVVIEEFLEGEEVSLLCFCDGATALPLPSAQDHKAAFDNDTGPNTGGMGAYSPAPVLPDGDLERLADIAVRPVLRELARQGHPFVGILYAGLMITPKGPKVLEYNVRFGDPECQPLLMRLDSDLLDVMRACTGGRLHEIGLKFKPDAAIGVVLAAEGYPGVYAQGMPITGIDAAERADPDAPGAIKVFVAGAQQVGGVLVAGGGRIACVTALGRDLASARQRAYRAMELVRMDKGRYRRDIGAKGLRQRPGSP
ncbi:MAG: phosphoribosylamine--glycine ligase, partial [Deltaproteobacteria bacterium]|nr:phosphoribosylamine--glycine ligase [Deltaproteobacteria bacterium]